MKIIYERIYAVFLKEQGRWTITRYVENAKKFRVLCNKEIFFRQDEVNKVTDVSDSWSEGKGPADGTKKALFSEMGVFDGRKDAAEYFHVSQATVGNWLKNPRKNVRLVERIYAARNGEGKCWCVCRKNGRNKLTDLETGEVVNATDIVDLTKDWYVCK